MQAIITITHRQVEHNDPAAAGFTDGWWWTVTIPFLAYYIESATASNEESEKIARTVAANNGAKDVIVHHGKQLLARGPDEARVTELITSTSTPD